MEHRTRGPGCPLPGQDRPSLSLQALEAAGGQKTGLFAQGTGAHPRHEPRRRQP